MLLADQLSCRGPYGTWPATAAMYKLLWILSVRVSGFLQIYFPAFVFADDWQEASAVD